MIFRYARHTEDLDQIEAFYTQIAGLQNLGGFEDHQGYNGLFLGHENSNWHLEFTNSDEKPDNKFDDDDILVFYVNSHIELSEIKKTIEKNHIKVEKPKNPYWLNNGLMMKDPDGFNVIFSYKELNFSSSDELTNLVKENSIKNWSDLIDFIRNVPYGRNSNRADFSLVLKENKGTCSSKHSFLKKIAELNNFEGVKLVLGIYKMNHINTPKIGNTIIENGLEYIPEAHCYLIINNRRIDITNRNSDIDNLTKDLIEEIEILPEQVNTFKVEYHKNYLKIWREKKNLTLSFDEIWQIREMCISKLEDCNDNMYQ